MTNVKRVGFITSLRQTNFLTLELLARNHPAWLKPASMCGRQEAAVVFGSAGAYTRLPVGSWGPCSGTLVITTSQAKQAVLQRLWPWLQLLTGSLAHFWPMPNNIALNWGMYSWGSSGRWHAPGTVPSRWHLAWEARTALGWRLVSVPRHTKHADLSVGSWSESAAGFLGLPNNC